MKYTKGLKIVRSLSLSLLIVFSLTNFTGCGDKNDAALIIDTSANNESVISMLSQIEYSNTDIQEFFKTLSKKENSIASSTSSARFLNYFSTNPSKGEIKGKIKGGSASFQQTTKTGAKVLGEITKSNKEIFTEYAQELQTTYSHDDIFSSIINASKSLTGSSNKLYIFSSGLSDSGSINIAKLQKETKFLDNNDNNDSSLENIKPGDLDIDFNKIEVTWIGLGGSISPQTPLSPEQIGRLKELWEKVLTKLGFKNKTFIDVNPNDNTAKYSNPNNYTVDKVDLCENKEIDVVKQFDSNTINFEYAKSDKFEGMTKSEVREKLKTFFEGINGEVEKLTITGYESLDNNQKSPTKLSKDRASFIKTIIEENNLINLKPKNITAIGGGFGKKEPKDSKENRYIELNVKTKIFNEC